MRDFGLRLSPGIVAIAAVFIAHAVPALAEPSSPGRVEFEVMRGGQYFGRQAVTVTEADGQLVANTSAELRAAIGPVTVFHYAQNCREVWNGGALTRLTCSTTKGGRQTQVQGSMQGASFRVQGPGGEADVPSGTLPTSWWTRPSLTTREMINTETGTRLPVRVTHIGRETIPVGAARISTDHIRVQGTLAVDLWYDDAGHWVSCAFSAGGQQMTYRLISPLSSAPA